MTNKVLIVSDDVDIGGTQTHLIYHSERLVELKNSVTLAAREGRSRLKLHPKVEFWDINFTGKNSIRLLYNSLIVLYRIKRNPPSVLHCHAAVLSLYIKIASLLLGCEIPIILTIHKMWEYDTQGMKKYFVPLLYKCLDYSADQIIVLNKTSYNSFMTQGFSSQKVSLIYNGIKIKTTNTLVPPDEQPKTWDVLFVGRFVRQKRLDLMIKTFALLKNYNQFHLHLVGDGPERMTLQRLVGQLDLTDMVTIHPPTIDLAGHFEKASLFTVTSEWEGISYSLLEALNYSLPIVGFNVPGVNEVVFEGENGLLVEFEDIKALSEKIIYLFNNSNEYNKLRQGCNTILEKKFDINISVDLISKIYSRQN